MARAPSRRAIPPRSIGLHTALSRIAGRADALDRDPRFPRENVDDLASAGVIGLPVDGGRNSLVREIELVRAVAAADGATARILDGHFNGVERLAMCGEGSLVAADLELVARGELLLGVWGADPAPSEGEPAYLISEGVGIGRLQGTKTFCSGAGGVQRALVVARDSDGARRLVYVDPRDRASVDRSWFRGSGLRASESHRVQFAGTAVLAVLGGPDELAREPWFSRDSVRTAATWAGIVDCIVAATVQALAGETQDEVRLMTVGEMRVAQATVDRWLEHTAGGLAGATDVEADSFGEQQVRQLAGECRIAIASASHSASAAAARACGSRALVGGGPLDRARRDLDLFLRQHRLEPRLIELGESTLGGAQGAVYGGDPAARFERLYAEDPDPWGYDTSTYEHEKFAATVAALPGGSMRALDVGGSNGVLTAMIAARCEEVVALDSSPRAVALARSREPGPNVQLAQGRFPDEIPAGRWDLIVCSEVLYYLTPAELWRALRWLRARLEGGATVLAVSWRGHGTDEPMRGDDVHDLLATELARWHTLDRRQSGYRLDRFDGADRD